MRRIFKIIDGIRIFALASEGRKSPVLLIHGNSASGDVFLDQIAELERADYPTVAPDLPGHGRSANAINAEATYSFPGYARVLRQLLNSLGILRYHIVGWSLGGHIGIELWHSDPNAASLLITGTPPVALSAQGAARGFKEGAEMNLAGTEVFGRREVLAYGSAMIGARIDGRSRLARTIARTDGKARFWMMKNGLAGVGTDQVRAVAECDRPLAIIQGRHDPFVNIPYLNELNYSNLWLREPVLIDCGHSPHLEDPELFNAHMAGFLQHVD